MDDIPFTPPPPVDPEIREEMEKSVKRMTEIDWFLVKYKVKHSPYIQKKYIKPLKKREKAARKRRRREWWKNNWISFWGLVFAVIAALPVISQGIKTILKWLGLLS